MIPGETVLSGAPLPYEGAKPEVMQSAAGHYIGFLCEAGEPYSRETIYMSHQKAVDSLIDGTWLTPPLRR